ncbi:hypothetical protein [Mycobacterium sp.]|uniref:hypothetical protein n=1 Tax=Mycobacterium sp. TaxID=1785 RepID=UPI003F99BE1C
MTAKKPRLIPATARVEPQRKPSRAQRIRQQRQATAWQQHKTTANPGGKRKVLDAVYGSGPLDVGVMTDPAGAPIAGPACTVAVLAAALADVDPDTPIVLQISGYNWLWRIGDIHLTAFTEHHHVDEATIALPQVYVVVEADKVIRYMPGVPNGPPDEDTANYQRARNLNHVGAPTDASNHSQKRCRGLLRRWWNSLRHRQ